MITEKIAAPSTVPRIDPRPPAKETPPITVIAAAIVLHEQVTVFSLAGIVLTLAGLVLSELKFGKKDTSEEKEENDEKTEPEN